jgi:hypothetical protein
VPRALSLIRPLPHYRHDAFESGLKACGYSVEREPFEAEPGDVLCCWNRYGFAQEQALRFEKRGATVLVAENAYLGNEFAGGRWYAIAVQHHNGAGQWPKGGPERWDGLGVRLQPWREPGGELVILPQRGVGPAGVAMPRDWLSRTERALRNAGIRYRVRKHPGQLQALALDRDLRGASAVATWGSGAALKALSWGLPVFYDMANWIGAPAGLPLANLLAGHAPQRDDEARLAMFRRMAWAIWRLDEIESGEAFRCLLSMSSRSTGTPAAS